MSSFSEILISVEKLSKAYRGNKFIFKDLQFELANGNSLGIKGSNGSGKSTLLKIISNLNSQTKGIIIYEYNEKAIKKEDLYQHIGFSAPYVNIYEEFTIEELAKIYADLKGINSYKVEFLKMLEMSGLYDHKDRVIKEFSSGMKQRVKIILSFLGSPPIIVMDEPGTNLDSEGKNFVKELIKEHISLGGTLILASNDEDELALCEKVIEMENYK